MNQPQVFGEIYAEAYDSLYKEKDYDLEVSLLERLFQEYRAGAVHRILDVGCGTGNHAIRLAQRGYQVTGVDQSLAMLQHARAKSAAISPPISWVHSRAVEFTSDQKFDAVLFMFTVLGYHIANQDVLGALQMARRHLVRGGLLLFDVWYGPAVLWQRPGERVRVIRSDTNTILRLTRGELNTRTHTCQVSYDLWKIVGDRVVSRTSEAHTVRFFFPEELRLILDISGFEILRIGAFPEWEKEPDETTWNVLVAAQTNAR